MTINLPQLISQKLAAVKPNQQIWLALSGGLDSTVLLHILANAPAWRSSLRAIHIDHGLSLHAKDWAMHCQRLCENWHIPCQIKSITSKPQAGESVEAWAREQRYRLITELLQTGDVVLTAHHQDDQAETVLLQLLRGAGPKGLSAMAEQSPLGKGYLLRPMLNVPRATIKNYALAHQLQWVDDDSNDSLRFDRNYLRQQVIPLLQARWPAVTKVLSRAADNCREMSEVLAEPMALYLQQVQITTDSLSVGALLALSAAKRHLVLQNWLQGFDCEISREQLLLIEQQVLLARIDAEPCLQLARLSIRRFDQKLYAVPPLSSIPVGYDQAWDGTQALYIPGLAEPLTKPDLAAQGLDVEALDWKQVRVKFRQGGERCKPKGRAHSQSLKRLLQEYRIAPWLRDRLPLIYCDDQLVMVVGAWVCA